MWVKTLDNRLVNLVSGNQIYIQNILTSHLVSSFSVNLSVGFTLEVIQLDQLKNQSDAELYIHELWNALRGTDPCFNSEQIFVAKS